jgi:DNA repair protein RecO
MSFYKQATGYIIHQRKFKNNSQIIEFFSYEFGKFQLVAKGINSNKNLVSQLQLFSLAKIQFYGSSYLKTLTSINLL